MLNMLSSILSWIVNEINHIITFILQIPVFVSYAFRWITVYIPSEILPYFVLALTVAVIIHIKRLVF